MRIRMLLSAADSDDLAGLGDGPTGSEVPSEAPHHVNLPLPPAQQWQHSRPGAGTRRWMTPIATGLLVAGSTCACGTTIGRIPFETEGEGQARINLDAESEPRFWTEFDATYDGELDAKYDVEVFQNGVMVERLSCDPLHFYGERICIVRIEGGDAHQLNCRMRCTLEHPLAAGSALVRARFSILTRPAHLGLIRADLVIRQ